MKQLDPFCVIFDMDGVLIDSEPLWKQAEIEIFREVGVPLTIEMCEQTTGLRMDAAVEHWYKRYPWKSKSLFEIGLSVKERVRNLILEKSVAKPGAIELVYKLAEKKIPLAICSSSALFIIEAVCEKFKVKNCFQVLQTAEDCSYGKPHPEPYLNTAKRLFMDPTCCIVIEDSLNGAISAKAACMKVIAVPEEHNVHKSIYDFCDSKFQSLNQITPDYMISLMRN